MRRLVRWAVWGCWCIAMVVSAAETSPPPQFVAVDTSRLMYSPDPLPPLRVEKAFPGLRFTKPLQVTHPGDGSDRILVCTQGGQIYVFPNRPDVKENDRQLFLDLKEKVSQAGGEEGLMSIAFHPKFRENGAFVVYYTIRPLASRVVGYRVLRSDPNRADPQSAVELMAFPQPWGNHNGGSMAFGPDGFLYIGLGDGGSGGDPQGNGQKLSTWLGKVLRIDVDHADPGRRYAVPKDNPFVGRKDALGEIWAYGVRNIWRLSFDRLTGALWAGDVGQNQWEEVDIIERGGNYGWNIREGTHPFRPGSDKGDEKLIEPLLDYSHAEGKSITGGIVYRGKKQTELYGAYLYADYVSGRIWALRYDGAKVTQNTEIAGSRLPISSFGEDRDGEVLLTAFDGFVYRLVPDAQVAGKMGFPRMLSETGLFPSTRDLDPAPGLIPYNVNVPLWSDGAIKDRYVVFPKEHAVAFSEKGAWAFPVGTVFVKNFSLDVVKGAGVRRQRLETRLLVRSERGWDGYTYRWNDEQTDAQLLDTAMEQSFQVAGAGGRQAQNWYFPSRADCFSCHTQASGFVLGANTRQLNRTLGDAQGAEQQLAMFERLGVFSGPLPPKDRLESFPRWGDPKADVTSTARAYLDVNCAICHQPGAASSSHIDLRYHTPLSGMGLLGADPRQHLGAGDSKLLTPGSVGRSELIQRMRARNEWRMPPLASSQVDEQGVKALSEWITVVKP